MITVTKELRNPTFLILVPFEHVKQTGRWIRFTTRGAIVKCGPQDPGSIALDRRRRDLQAEVEANKDISGNYAFTGKSFRRVDNIRPEQDSDNGVMITDSD